MPVSIPHLGKMSLSHGIKISSEFALGWDALYYTKPDSMEPNTRITIGLGKHVRCETVRSA